MSRSPRLLLEELMLLADELGIPYNSINEEYHSIREDQPKVTDLGLVLDQQRSAIYQLLDKYQRLKVVRDAGK